MNPRIVSFHYTLTDPSGKTLDSSAGQEPLTYMEGASQIIPGLEKAMLLLQAQDKRKISVPAAEAYGPREESQIFEISKDKFPPGNIKVGDQFQAGADEDSPPFTVLKVTDSHLTLDANHPLAGIDLTFEVEITATREATSEELAHGHAHGPEGHGH